MSLAGNSPSFVFLLRFEVSPGVWVTWGRTLRRVDSAILIVPMTERVSIIAVPLTHFSTRPWLLRAGGRFDRRPGCRPTRRRLSPPPFPDSPWVVGADLRSDFRAIEEGWSTYPRSILLPGKNHLTLECIVKPSRSLFFYCLESSVVFRVRFDVWRGLGTSFGSFGR
jgi:hypothetical protein